MVLIMIRESFSNISVQWKQHLTQRTIIFLVGRNGLVVRVTDC